MLLTQLINRLQPLAVSGKTEDRWVSGVAFDSRKVEQDSLFVAVSGTQVDGHQFIEQAIAQGATTIVCEQLPDFTTSKGLAEGASAGAKESGNSSDEVPSPTPPQGRGAMEDATASFEQASLVLSRDYWSVDFQEGNAIKEFAKQLRKNQTKAEDALWQALRANKTGYHFHRQKPMGRSIPDFVCLKKQVVIEVDGGYHGQLNMLWADDKRDQMFNAAGYVVLRFTNDQVLGQLSKVVSEIQNLLDQRDDRQVRYPDEYINPTLFSEANLASDERLAHASPLPSDKGAVGEGPGEGITFIQVSDSAKALALLATEFHGNPSAALALVGVTGTNGKTTVTTLLHDLFTSLGYKAGLLSTVEVRIGSSVRQATHTTPDAVAINATLADMVAAGCDYVFMEVSSHAVAQHRTCGLAFSGGVFTNLTHDHLDYHGTFANYRDAKKGFFDQLPKGAFALVNADDRNGDFMLQNTKARKLYYSLRKVTAYRAKVLSNSPQGLQLELDGTEVFTRMIGRFNAYNLIAAFGVAQELEMDRDETLVALSSLTPAAGRLEHVVDPTGGITAIVDYAHTPDALENVLTTLQEVKSPEARLICVVGAGGDRDKKKRPEMARIAASLADQAILTSDNPRSEDPEVILNDMQAGLTTAELQVKTLRITDRRSAIRTAVQLATRQDVVLVAGKGHETYQEIKGERLPFDDKLELANALNTRTHVG